MSCVSRDALCRRVVLPCKRFFDDIGSELEERFVTGLRMFESLDDFEVVIRQARERGHLRAATLAARIGAEDFPDDAWIHSVHGNTQRAIGDNAGALASYQRNMQLLMAEGMNRSDQMTSWLGIATAASKCGKNDVAADAIKHAKELALADDEWDVHYAETIVLAQRDAAAARDAAVELVGKLALRPRLIAESQVGFASVDLALNLLLPVKDRRAIDVATKLITAKQSLWGDCPAVWVERQNLGTVYAQLGDSVKARSLISEAHGKLLAQLGAQHEHVKLCERSLARLSN